MSPILPIGNNSNSYIMKDIDDVDRIKEMGVVGAGGAGFPSHVKVGGKADLVLVNAAECEPLLHKDKELLDKKTEPFFKGLKTVMAAVGARKGTIGIKEKHRTLIENLKAKLPEDVGICPVADFYPAGDEITLIRETTGKIILPGSLPSSEGIVVMNVESLYNIGMCQPVITKFVNIAGCVENLHTLNVPLGISFEALLEYARPTIQEYIVIEGGPMMGSIVTDLKKVVTKTTAALIVLPVDHVLIKKYTDMASPERVNRIGKSACDQCSFCTELCPRYLLGHPVQPHLAMRSLIFDSSDSEGSQVAPHTLYCCQCNLCSFVACPEGLYPSQVCINKRKQAIAQKVKYEGELSNKPHPMAEYRKIPSSKLKQMLDLNRFTDEGALVSHTFTPATLKLLLQQHIGTPASPLVQINDLVTSGQKIATTGESLGSEIHSPAAGVVVDVTGTHIEIRVDYP